MNGNGKSRPRFKTFSLRLHDLAYSPVLKHKIGTKRKRLLHQKNNSIYVANGQKRMKLTDSNDDIDKRRDSSPIRQANMTVCREQDSTAKLCQVEQCWLSRTAFIEAFDLDQYEDSRDAARTLLKWLIYPVECDKFLKYCTASYISIHILLCPFIGSSGKESRCY